MGICKTISPKIWGLRVLRFAFRSSGDTCQRTNELLDFSNYKFGDYNNIYRSWIPYICSSWFQPWAPPPFLPKHLPLISIAQGTKCVSLLNLVQHGYKISQSPNVLNLKQFYLSELFISKTLEKFIFWRSLPTLFSILSRT